MAKKKTTPKKSLYTKTSAADGKRVAKPVGKRKVTKKDSPNYGKTYVEKRPDRADLTPSKRLAKIAKSK